jgi:CRP/FNR family transcriptional regulator
MDWMSETFEVELLSEIMQNRIEEIDADTILLSEGTYIKKIPLLLDKLRELAYKHGNAIPLTQQKLAAEIGSAREVVSRLLKQLEVQGIVKLDRGTIKSITICPVLCCRIKMTSK